MSATPLPTTVFALALICQVLLHALVSARPLVSWPWRAAGIFLVAFGLIFNLIADRQFKRARTPVSPRDTPAVLVTDGVFAWSRNPMYTGMVVLLLGVAILLGTLTPFVVPALFAWHGSSSVPRRLRSGGPSGRRTSGMPSTCDAGCDRCSATTSSA